MNENTDYYKMGRERGHAAGTWIIDGNTDLATARRIVQGLEDCDPEIMDMEPAWLSGEWAGESLKELGLDNASDDDLYNYEHGAADAYWSEVSRAARNVIGQPDNDNESENR